MNKVTKKLPSSPESRVLSLTSAIHHLSHYLCSSPVQSLTHSQFDHPRPLLTALCFYALQVYPVAILYIKQTSISIKGTKF